MPIYEYEHVKPNPDCEESIEVFQKMSEDPLTKCPICGKKIQKLLSRTSGIADKMGPSKLKELGFSRWHRRDKGVYEKE